MDYKRANLPLSKCESYKDIKIIDETNLKIERVRKRKRKNYEKIMKNILSIINVVVLFLFLTSCSENETMNQTMEQQILETYKPELLNLLDLNSKKTINTVYGDITSFKINSEKESYLFKDYNNNYSIATISNDIISHESLTSENVLFMHKTLNFNFSKKANDKFKIIDFSNIEILDKSKEIAGRSSDSSCESEFWLDTGLCSVAAVGIAASDGPLPFADAVALTFFTACFHRANLTLSRCIDSEQPR